jgi:predicted Zn-dependent protease
MTSTRGLDVAYQLDRTAVTAAEAAWLARLPDASPDEQDDALIELRASARRDGANRNRLHLIGMGLAEVGRPEEAISFFIRSNELDPATGVDAVNAAVAMVQVGDLERARLWLAPIAQGDGDLSDVANRFITEIERAQQARRTHVPEVDPNVEPTRAQVNELLQSAALRGGDAQLAVHSLRILVHRNPDNEYYRETLMFALMAHSEIAEALTQAEMLENRPEPNHERHFNLAQTFWHGGERQRAYNHFALAHQLARTDEERHDVVSMVEYLREQDDLLDDD